MKIYAYFDNIHKHILHELNQTMFDVTAAIAWFTDEDIYNLLCKKAAQNVSVRVLLIKDQINTGQYGLNFDRLKELGGQVFFIPDPKHSGVTMHHKFCVIDDNTVVTGSYNWSKCAQQNYENITVIKDNIELARKYREEFENILAKKAGVQQDTTQILTRLDLIMNLILLGETEDINRHLEKLRLLEGDQEMQDIVSLLQNLDFNSAISRIQQYKNQRQAITDYQDPGIASLKLELKSLEIEINALSDEKAEMERQILYFNHLQNQNIGELLAEYFRHRKEKLRRAWVQSEKNTDKYEKYEKEREQRKTEFEEANREYEEYKDDYEASKKEDPLPEITEEKQKKLKDLYRRASCLCHPDKVAESDKKRAHETFVELQEAYQINNLETLQKILKYLREEKIFADKAETISEKDSIKREIIHLRRQIEKILDQLNQLVSTTAWQTISAIEDWGDYFDDQKNKLEEEIELMKAEFENA